MDKNSIKKFAVWARTELITRVSQRAIKYEIDENGYGEYDADAVNGRVMSAEEKTQRKALIDRIRKKGYHQVMEEVAYTWFNRFSALRFMEVNGYLPSRTRVFTDENNNFKPQIITDAIDLTIDGLDMEKVYELKDDAKKEEELYKYLLITQCNALNPILPGMFQKISDYTELLFPDNLLRENSVIQKMIELIPQQDWEEQVEILGWLYQYYINEPKDKLINAKKQYKLDDVPFVTQIFTSDWIVQYMVQNSLGRMWINAGDKDLKDYDWDYYLQERDGAKKEASIDPSTIKVIDPCMGSGHIIAYIFDALIQMYDNYGYTRSDAVDCGYWHLWRFNPLLADEGKNPFTLDSKAPKWEDFRDFLLGEVRYLSVQKAFPKEADELFSQAEKMAKLRYQTYVRKSQEDWSEQI